MSKIINCVYIKRINNILKDIQDDICEIKKKNNSPIKNPDIKGDIIINGDIYPKKNKKYNLGLENKKFKELYLSGNSIHLGKKLVLKNNNNNLVISSNNSSININDQENSIINLENSINNTNSSIINLENSSIENTNSIINLETEFLNFSNISNISKLVNLQGSVTINSSSIVQLQSSINTNSSNIVKLQSSIITNDNNINNVKSSLNNIIDLENSINTNNSNTINLENNVNSNISTLTNYHNIVHINELNIIDTENSINNYNTDTINLENSITDNIFNISQLQYNVINNYSSIINLETNVNINNNSIIEIKSEIEDNTNNNSIINSLHSIVNYLQSSLLINSSDIYDLQNSIASHISNINNLNTSVITNNNNISNLDSNINNNNSSIISLESSILFNSNSLSNIKNPNNFINFMNITDSNISTNNNISTNKNIELNQTLEHKRSSTSIAINYDGTFLIVSDPYYNYYNYENAGRIYSYIYENNEWKYLQHYSSYLYSSPITNNILFGYSVSIQKSATVNDDHFWGIAGTYHEDPKHSFVSMWRQKKSENYNANAVSVLGGDFSGITNDDKYYGKIVLLSDNLNRFIASDKNVFLYIDSYTIKLYNDTTNQNIIESMAINNDGTTLVIGKPSEDKIYVFNIGTSNTGILVTLFNTLSGNSSGDYFGNSISFDNNTNIVVSAKNGGYIKRYQKNNNWGTVVNVISINLGILIDYLNISNDGSTIIYSYTNSSNNKIGLLNNLSNSLEEVIINSNENEYVTDNFVQVILNNDGTTITRIINNDSNDKTNKIYYYNIENSQSNNELIINNNSYYIIMNNTSNSIEVGTNSKSILLNINEICEIYVINDRLFYNISWSKIT